jgi:flavin-dependent dehydrogenase
VPASRAFHYHVAVVGGGPAGLAAAMTLVHDGLTAVLIERTDYDSFRVGEHLPPSAQPLLSSLGIADLLSDTVHACCPGIRSVWGAPEPADKDYIFHPCGQGWNLSRPAFDRGMLTHAAGLGAAIFTRTKVFELRRASGRWNIALAQQGKTVAICADVLIDATGRTASIAKRLGAKPIVYDDLVGVVGRARASSPLDHRLFIEALEGGWWYSAGLSDGSIVATFLTDSDLVNTSRAGPDSAWRAQLAASVLTAGRMAAVDPDNEVQIRTARSQRLDAVDGEGWLAVGDAAMSFDPLSSEGISKGVEWGRKAARAATALCRGDRSGALDYREELERAFSAYLRMRERYYGMERRWPHAPFWRRRHVSWSKSRSV